MPTVTLHIDGMSCGHCLNAVTEALNTVPGAQVQSVQIGRAVVTTTPDGPSAEVLAAAVTHAGYPATSAVA